MKIRSLKMREVDEEVSLGVLKSESYVNSYSRKDFHLCFMKLSFEVS